MRKKLFLIFVISVLTMFSFAAYAQDEEFVGGIGFEDSADLQTAIESPFGDMVFSDEELLKQRTTPFDISNDLDQPETQADAAEATLSADTASVKKTAAKIAPQPPAFLGGVNTLIQKPSMLNIKKVDEAIQSKATKEGATETATNDIPTVETMSAAVSTYNSDPNSAEYIPVNNYFSSTMSYQGQQAWFLTQAPARGQMTFHFEVPRTSVDYDMYIYKLDLTTGYINPVKACESDPGRNEHASLMVEADDIYFFALVSYSGSSTSPYNFYLGFNTDYTGNETDDTFSEANPVQLYNNTTDTLINGFLGNYVDEDYYRLIITGNKTVINFVNASSTQVGIRLYNASYQPINTSGYIIQNEDDPNTMIKVGTFNILNLNPGTYFLKFTSMNKLAISGAQYIARVGHFSTPNNEQISKILTRTADNARIAYITTVGKFCVNSALIRDGFPTRKVTIVKGGWRYDWGPAVQTEYTLTATDVSGSIGSCYFVRFSSGLASIYDAFAVYSDDGHYSNVYRYRVENTTQWKNYKSTSPRTDGYFIIDLRDGTIKDVVSGGNGFYAGYFDPDSYSCTELTTY